MPDNFSITSSPVPIPSSAIQDRSALTVVVSDKDAIVAVIEQLLNRAGLSQAEVCRRLGISASNFNQYRLMRRHPSVWWLARLAGVCGARIVIEYPSRPL